MVVVVVDPRNLPLKLFVAAVVVVVVFVVVLVVVGVVVVVVGVVVVDNNDVVFDVVSSLKPSIKVWSVIDEMLLLLLPSSAQLNPTPTQLVGLR